MENRSIFFMLNDWQEFDILIKIQREVIPMLTGRHLIQPDDLSVSEINEICSLAEQIIVDPKSFQDVCRGKILATLFFEPSTRTRLSF